MLALVTFIIMLPLVARAQDEDFKFPNEPKFCTPYRCPKGQEPVPKWPLKLTSTGCSGIGGGMQMFSPKGGGDNEKTTACCDQRNACLQTCGSIKTFCDEEFMKCAKASCEDLTGEEKDSCDKSVNMHELLLKLDTCQRYNKEQSEHCECVPKESVESKREKVLRAFYNKFNKENVAKTPELAKKASTTAKMAGLMMKLYKKYPQVIKKIKDPQQVSGE